MGKKQKNISAKKNDKKKITKKEEECTNPGETPGKKASTVAGRVFMCICIVLLAVFTVIIVYNITMMVKGMAGLGYVPSGIGFGFVSYRADGMAPTFEEGDLILIRDCNPEKLRVEDVISFSTESAEGRKQMLTRRIAAVIHNDDGTTMFRTRTDEDRKVDSFFVSADSVAGKYVTSVPRMGRVFDYLISPPGMLISVLCEVLLLIAVSTRFYRRRREI